MSRIFGIIFCGALMLLAGCATSPNESPESSLSPGGALPPNWAETNFVTQPPFHRPAPPPPVVKTNRPPSPPAAVAVRPAPVFAWTSLNRWAAECKLAAPRRLVDGPLTEFSISSSNGVMVLGIGSREATWNGVEFHLGFAPELVDDQVFMHGLDLQKNLEPLLCDKPLSFPGPRRVIVIDPGHGGLNSGTVSVLDHRPEKEFTLDLARRIKPLLEAEGWQVFLTRTNDTDLALSNRVSFAEAHHANAFISLHFNSAAPEQRESGLETYCITPTGMPSTLTRGFSDPWTEVLPNNSFDAQNLQLALRLQTAVLRATGEEDRGVRRARFIGVLRGQRRPAVLIEGGFLSNPREARRIEDPAFRQKLAEAIAGALK